MSKYITVAEARDLTGRHRQSIYNAIADGRVRSKTVNAPGVRGGKLTLVHRGDIERGVWRRKNNSTELKELS